LIVELLIPDKLIDFRRAEKRVSYIPFFIRVRLSPAEVKCMKIFDLSECKVLMYFIEHFVLYFPLQELRISIE
jgi:hypothetical protein